MNKYEITTEKKKKEIIQAAMTLFCDKGFTKVGMKEIALLAQVSQVTIYNYFGSKEALISVCVDIVMDDTFQKAKEILNSEKDFVVKIKSALLLCSQHVNLSISQYFSPAALNDSTLINLLIKNIDEKKRFIYTEYIEAGKQEKALDNNIPTETYLAFFDAINVMGTKLEFTDNAAKELENIQHLLLYGIIGN